MKSFTLLSALMAAGLVAATPTPTEQQPPSKRASLPQVSASGNAFWANGKRFYMRGIDYKPGGNGKNIDPLADPVMCARDIAKFKDLGVNTIRIYAVDNSADHDKCMSLLADAGIYLVADVNSPKYSINQLDWSHALLSYNSEYLQSVFATVELMSKYDNTIAFFSGNEVINKPNNTQVAPFVKAVTRDIKAYQKARKLRAVPVGYSAADVEDNRVQTADYLNCGTDDVRSDFFAFNDYSWCNTDFHTSKWDEKVQTFSSYGIPIFLSEYGCIENRPRKFDELGALMSANMSSVYSGGIMFEYSKEENDFGIVTIKGDVSTGTVSELSEYKNFKSALAKYATPTGSGGAATTTKAVSCPAYKAGVWEVDPSSLPIMPVKAKDFFTNGAGKGVGMAGDGSQLPKCTANDGPLKCGLSPGNTTESSSGSGSKGNGTSGSDKEGSAGSLQAPLLAGLTMVVGLVGTLLL